MNKSEVAFSLFVSLRVISWIEILCVPLYSLWVKFFFEALA